jgi:hypothetical protein
MPNRAGSPPLTQRLFRFLRGRIGYSGRRGVDARYESREASFAVCREAREKIGTCEHEPTRYW